MRRFGWDSLLLFALLLLGGVLLLAFLDARDPAPRPGGKERFVERLRPVGSETFDSAKRVLLWVDGVTFAIPIRMMQYPDWRLGSQPLPEIGGLLLRGFYPDFSAIGDHPGVTYFTASRDPRYVSVYLRASCVPGNRSNRRTVSVDPCRAEDWILRGLAVQVDQRSYQPSWTLDEQAAPAYDGLLFLGISRRDNEAVYTGHVQGGRLVVVDCDLPGGVPVPHCNLTVAYRGRFELSFHFDVGLVPHWQTVLQSTERFLDEALVHWRRPPP